MNVLITGGAGFLGGHLAHRLVVDGTRVALLDDFSRAVRDPFLEALAADPRVRLIARDLRDEAALADLPDDLTHVVHLAAIVGVAHVLARPFDVLADNARTTLSALAIARRQRRLERFLFASTSEVLAGTLATFGIPFPSPESTPIVLADPGEPRSSYLLSKAYGEALCHHSGLPFTVVRPHNVYGPRMGLSHVVPELAARVAELPPHGRLEVRSPEHRRTFCYVDDAVAQIAGLLAAEEAIGGTFNVGAQEPEVTIRDLASEVVRAMERPDVGLVDGPTTPGSPERRCPDIGRTVTVTGHVPRVGMAEGVRRTVSWYREHVFAAPAGASAR